jgi:hypothetical protein
MLRFMATDDAKKTAKANSTRSQQIKFDATTVDA